MYVEVKKNDESDGKKSRPPINDEHDCDAEQRSKQTQPKRVKPKRWSPPYTRNNKKNHLNQSSQY